MERADPRAAGARAEDLLDPLAHLARGLVGEGDRDDAARRDAGLADEPGDAVGDDAGLSGAGPGEHEQRAARVDDRLPLRGVRANRANCSGGFTPRIVAGGSDAYSTVTLLARLRGWSTSQPRSSAMW